MIRGLYTAATGMMVQRNKMDTLTNNLVNAETTGYKKETLVSSTFTEVMLDRLSDSGDNGIGSYAYGNRVDQQYIDFSQGSLEETGKATDLAIIGDGFFVVQTAAGDRYTRAGNFAVDGEGYLVNGDGCYVLGRQGRIQAGGADFIVQADGAVLVDGAAVDTLRIETFTDLNVLRKQGDNLYYGYGDAAAVNATGFQVSQGVQENSNMDVVSGMVELLTLYRKYEANQKVVTMTNETLSMAVNLGKLGG